MLIHIASMPFWLLGVVTAALGITGLLGLALKVLFSVPFSKTSQAVEGALVLLLVSGLSFWFAAWLCS